MNAHFNAPRVPAQIHAARCGCPRCRTIGQPRDPREDWIPLIMCVVAIAIGATLGHLVTPQQIAAAIVAAF